MIIADTNVVSEMMRPAASLRVLAWARALTTEVFFTTAITRAEILFGLATMPGGQRRSERQAAAERIFGFVFMDRVLPFAADCAPHYAAVRAACQGLGRPIEEPDARIAAIARARGAILATRNTRDFALTGVVLIDPWDD